MRILLSSIFILGFFNLALSQSQIAINEWRSYLPHNIVRKVEQSPEKIIYATAQAIMTLDKEDMSVEYLSKVDGLTETGIKDIEYDNFNGSLIIVYDNSIIDIVNGSEVYPIFDLFNNTTFIDRKINDIYIQNEEWMYLATGFGVLQYNLIDREFGFTLDAGQGVNHIDGNEEYIVISGDEGLYILDYANTAFPNAFTSWQEIGQGLPTATAVDDLLFLNDKLYLGTLNTIYKSGDLNTFEAAFDVEDDFNLIFLQEHDGGLLVGLKDGSSSSKLLMYDDMETLVNEISSCTNRLLDVEIDALGRVFFADEWLNVRYIDEEGVCQRESFYGPFSEEASDFSIKDDVVYVASGGISDIFTDRFGRDGIYILENGEWNNVNQDNNAFYKDEDVIQFYQIEAHPREDRLYVGSFWAGLVEQNLETGDQILYTAENTGGALLPPSGDEQRTRISGLAFDRDNNLWISCYNAPRPLAVYTNEGTWHNFDLPGDNQLTDLAVDDLGNVWGVIAGSSGAVVVYNPGENIKDPTDDIPARLFNVNNSEVPSNVVNAIAKDRDGGMWVGTAQGVVLFDCGGAVFDDICTGDKPIVFQDNVGAFLLETENILSIAVDGANRKWFGTTSGIFVQSPDGEEEVARYNVDNSPLFDNRVVAMAFNDNTGEMFIATDKGIQSFRTPTTGARTTHSGNVYAFPNPVRPEYRGDIAIKGLARDAEVKITDIDGQLVFQTTALGGQAVWDGRDLNGQDVSGGVYLVFSVSSDAFVDPDTAVTKILVVR